MAVKLEEFFVKLGFKVDTKKVKEFNKSFERTKNIAKGFTKVVGVLTGVFTGFATTMGLQIATNYNLAKSVEMSIETFEALGGVMGDIGMSERAVIDMTKELNKRLGEKKVRGVYPDVDMALQKLGISFKDIQKLKPEEQFIKLADAAKSLKDTQTSVNVAFKLFGRRGADVMGLLRTYDESIVDLIDKRQKLNLLDKESRLGTVAFKAALDDVSVTVRSLGGLIFGQLAKSLEPLIKQFIDWAAANREIIRINIIKFANTLSFVIKIVAGIIQGAVRVFMYFSEAVGGVDGALKLLMATAASFALGNALAAIASLTKALKGLAFWQVITNGLAIAAPLLIGALGLALYALYDDVKTYMDGGESVIGHFIDFLETEFPAAFHVFKEIGAFLFEVWEHIKNIWGGISKIGKWIGAEWSKAGEMLFGGGEVNVNRSATYTPAKAVLRPSAAAMNSTTNQSTQAVKVEAPMTIYQQPGESSDDFALKVSKALGEEVATAARALSTGIVR